jgi:methylisocitrate lyase
MDRTCVAMPGAFNGLVARAVADGGFEACYVSGGATSAAAGVPDVGLLSLDHFTRVVREVAEGSGLPVLADADTGFGEAEMVRRTVVEYHRAGAAGLHIEDQVFPKRCGHLDGKQLVPVDHFREKVTTAAKAARECGDGSFIICARTDAAGVDGLDAALDRARAYLDAGADMIFPEGLHDVDEFVQFARTLRRDAPKCYLLANMTEFGKTPMIPLDRFAEMGYSCVIFPVSLLRVAMGAVVRALGTLKADGSLEAELGGMQSRAELYRLLGYEPGKPWNWPAAR